MGSKRKGSDSVMVLNCDQSNFRVRTDNSVKKHGKELSVIRREDSNILHRKLFEPNEKNIDRQSPFVNESLDNEIEIKPFKYKQKDAFHVQDHEITSTKEPMVANGVEITPVNKPIVMIDVEPSEYEAGKEALLEDHFDKAETVSITKLPSHDLVYTLVCVHIETFRVSNEPSISLTQIGCTTALNIQGEKETFFQPVKPARLEHFLENFKMEGDLLQALHMTDEKGRFQFRGQFEIKRKEKNKIFATEEEKALDTLIGYLEKFENVVLFAVDENTLEIVLDKLEQFRPISDLPIVGFSTWPKVLKECSKFTGTKIYEEESDLEDFYTEHCEEITGYITALDVANFLRKAVKKLGADYAKYFAAANPGKNFTRNNFVDEIVEDIHNIEANAFRKVEPAKPITVEVFSSFRPEVSTKIGIEEMDTIELSSGEESEDSDIDIVEENLKPKYYTKSKSIEDSDLSSAKRKHPYDFPEYPSAKRPVLNYSGDPIMISSDEEDDEVTLDEETLPLDEEILP